MQASQSYLRPCPNSSSNNNNKKNKKQKQTKRTKQNKPNKQKLKDDEWDSEIKEGVKKNKTKQRTE